MWWGRKAGRPQRTRRRSRSTGCRCTADPARRCRCRRRRRRRRRRWGRRPEVGWLPEHRRRLGQEAGRRREAQEAAAGGKATLRATERLWAGAVAAAAATGAQPGRRQALPGRQLAAETPPPHLVGPCACKARTQAHGHFVVSPGKVDSTPRATGLRRTRLGSAERRTRPSSDESPS